MDKLSHAAAIVRTYNNPGIVACVRDLIACGIGRVVVVVNEPKDNNTTIGALVGLQSASITIISMAEDYSWSNALNKGVEALFGQNEQMFALFVSVEVQFSKHHLEKMLNAMTDPLIGAVGTSFEGIFEGKNISLGLSYRHPRNTLMLVRLGIIKGLGGFDPWCDNVGGQEDIDFLIRMTSVTKFGFKRLDLRVPLLIGRHYNQSEKEVREQEAIKQIIARRRELLEVSIQKIS